MGAVRTIRVQVDVLDMEGNVLSSIDQRLVDGQVTVATDADGPTRSLSVTLYDPERRLRLDSDAPTAGSLFADRMLRVTYGVLVPGIGWVDVPVFTGVIMVVSRDDVVLNVECHGKEALALQPVWKTYHVEKGVRKTDAIRRIMRECAGESRFDLPDKPTRLGSAASLTSVAPEKRRKFNADTPWGLCRKIAQSMDMHLFYDGQGVLRLRKLPGSPLFTFGEDIITSAPQLRFDMTEMRNAVRVTGKTLHEGKEQKGPQQPTHEVNGSAVAPSEHPLSPRRLGRKIADGSIVPRYIPEFVTNDAVRSDQEADRLAKRILDDRLAQQVDISFDSLPVPHLEEMDLIRVAYEDMRLNVRLKQFSLPLTHAGTMSVGSNKRVTKPRRR